MDNKERFNEIIGDQFPDGQLPPDSWYDPEIGGGDGCLADQFEHLNAVSALGSIAIELADDLHDATEQLAEFEPLMRKNDSEPIDDFDRTEFLHAEAREEASEQMLMVFSALYDSIEEEVANASNPADQDCYDEAIIRGTKNAIAGIEELCEMGNMTELEALGATEYINKWAMQYRLEPTLHFQELRWGF